jgi:hypothetical protein
MRLLFLAIVCASWCATGALITTWWFTRHRRKVRRDVNEWFGKLPNVRSLPPVRSLPRTYDRATWARPIPPERASLRTSAMWRPEIARRR